MCMYWISVIPLCFKYDIFYCNILRTVFLLVSDKNTIFQFQNSKLSANDSQELYFQPLFLLRMGGAITTPLIYVVSCSKLVS